MRLGDVSLKWRLLAAFLLISFFGTTALVWIAFRSQQALIHLGERRTLESHYQQLLQGIQAKRDQALSLAWSVALDPHVQEFFARRDREALLEHVTPMYRRLHDDFGVRQIHFHIPPATSFLRIHRPERYGERMDEYRRTVLHAVESRRGVSGIEWGPTGHGIRGVVPVEKEGSLIGTVEVGFSLGHPFAREFKARYGCDLTVYAPDVDGEDHLAILASTVEGPTHLRSSDFREFQARPSPVFKIPIPGKEDSSALIGPVTDFSDSVVVLVEVRIDRGPTLALLSRYRTEMTIVEVAGLILATLVVWIVVQRFLSPIGQMVQGAAEIVSGERLHMPVRGKDEMGRLARALNNMVGYLEASRQRMKDYATNLEMEVQARTRQLRESEEKFRTLVEKVPLMVYRMTPERDLTFVNEFSKEMLGASPSELMGSPRALDAFVHPADLERVRTEFWGAVSGRREWVGEYRMRSTQGRIAFVREHAVPVADESGNVLHVDGIIVDLTDQKELQEKSVQSEELKTLWEISARLAHEIRNPLTSIGGLSRRLLKELPEGHSARRWIEAIVQEVQRLETILQMTLSYIQPIEVRLCPDDLTAMLKGLLVDISPEFSHRGRGLSWSISPGIPKVPMDRPLLSRAFESLCRHTLFIMDEGGTLMVTAEQEDDRVRISWRYPSSVLSRDDLDHYFYPFHVEGPPDPALLDLPMAKVILFRHGGLVRADFAAEHEVLLTVTLPAVNPEEGAGKGGQWRMDVTDPG
jgi:PAS domain S-box-containing protein